MINYSKEIGKVVTIVLALIMMAPVGLTFTGGEIILADNPPLVILTPNSKEQPQQDSQRVVLVEAFTNWGVVNCEDFEENYLSPVIDFYNNDSFSVVAPGYVHCIDFQNDPFYGNNPQKFQERAAFYSVSTSWWDLPDLAVDGNMHRYPEDNQSVIMEYIEEQLGLPSSFSIKTTGTIDEVLLTGSITANIEVIRPVFEPVEGLDLRVMFYLWEDHITRFKQPFGKNDLFRWGVWDILPDANGIPISMTSPGEYATLTQNFSINSTWDVNQLGVTVFIQNFNTNNPWLVEQAAVEDFEKPAVILHTPDPLIPEEIFSGLVPIDWAATDLQDDDATLDISIEYSLDTGTNWLPIMSGVDNNNPPYLWNTVAQGIPDGANYMIRVVVTDSDNRSISTWLNDYELFSIDNTPNDRWYLQVESMNLGNYLDLDMKPFEREPQEINVDVSAPGEYLVQTFASEYVAPCEMDLGGNWTFSMNAKVTSSYANGTFYANIYSDAGAGSSLLFTTSYDDEFVGDYTSYHDFYWVSFVPIGTFLQANEHVVVEIMLHATEGAGPSSSLHYADADIPIYGNVTGNYTLTFDSDDQRQIIEEFTDPNGTMIPILNEDFSRGIPHDWKIVNNGAHGPGRDTWTTKNPGDRKPNLPIEEPFPSCDALVFPRYMDEHLVTPVFDFSYTSIVTLEFDQWIFQAIDNHTGNRCDVDISSSSTNGSWVSVLHQDPHTSTPNPEHISLNISAYAARANTVKIRFRFIAGPLFWIIDNVLINVHITSPVLEHKWTINVPPGEDPYVFSLEARRPNTQKSDDFLFSYSLDDNRYKDMFIVSSKNDRIRTYSLPTSISGKVYIRVIDDLLHSNPDVSTIEIDQMFISGGPPVLTLGLDHYTTPSLGHNTTPSFIEPSLALGPVRYLCIQDAPGGLGSNVTTHDMTTDETFTVWAIGFDKYWNYKSEISTNWTNTLNAQTATTSTFFTLDPTGPGVGTISAIYNTTLSDTTGLITVTTGLLSNILIRDNPGGMGNVVGTYSMTTDDTLTVWAAGYDADGNYIGDVNCNWSTNETLDLHSAIMVNNLMFDPSTAGTSGYIFALNGSISDSAGLITVGVGAFDHISIRHEPGGAGSEVTDVLMVLGQTLIVYSAGYDADNNYIGDIPCNWTTTGTLNFTMTTSSTSFSFEPAVAGETGTINATFNTTIFDETGTITVTDSGIDYIRIEDGLGNEIFGHTMDTSETFTVWAIGYNFTEGEVGPVNADWTTTPTLDLQTATTSQSFTFDPIHAPTSGTIEGLYGILWDTTGTITVNTGPLSYLCIQDASGGTGANVTTYTMTTDDTFTVWSIGYDAMWNYISEIPSNWTNTLNAQTATISTVFTLDPTAPGSGTITAVFNATLSDMTGLITVTVGLFNDIIIRDFPGGLGNEVNAYSMTIDDTLTVWSAGYDSEGNYIGDVNCNWSTNETLDLHSAIMVNNLTFDPSTAGTSGYILAFNGSISDSAGLITVGLGGLNHIIIRHEAGGAGSEVTNVTVLFGQTLTVYSAGYDAENNYIGDIPCNWTTTGTLNLTTATSSSSFTFEPAVAGETGTFNATFNSTISDVTGTINVIEFGIDYIRIEDGLGNEIFGHTMDTSETFTVWAIGYNSSAGEVGPVNADWTTTPTLDLQTATTSQSFTFDPIHAPTLGAIIATFGLEWDQAAPITVNPGPLANLCIQDAPDGTGANVTTHAMTTIETLTLWSIGFDSEWNYISNINCDWATTGTLDLQTAMGINTFTFSPINPGAGTITADFNAIISDSTGIINVTDPPAPVPTFDIDITPAAGSNGWILISFPSQIEGDPLTLIVDAVDEGAGLVTWDIVQWYDPTSPSGTEWKTTATFKPPQLNTFNYVNNTFSFWIHITNYGDGNLTIQGDMASSGEFASIELLAGWNLVGYPFPTAQPMINTLVILTNLDMPVETYDSADPYRLRTVDIFTEDHEPGHGYWLHVAADEILIIQCP